MEGVSRLGESGDTDTDRGKRPRLEAGGESRYVSNRSDDDNDNEEPLDDDDGDNDNDDVNDSDDDNNDDDCQVAAWPRAGPVD